MKWLIIGLIILVGLSISDPVFAANSVSTNGLWFIYPYGADWHEPSPFTTEFINFADTTSYKPVNWTDVIYYPLDDMDLKVTAHGELVFSDYNVSGGLNFNQPGFTNLDYVDCVVIIRGTGNQGDRIVVRKMQIGSIYGQGSLLADNEEIAGFIPPFGKLDGFIGLSFADLLGDMEMTFDIPNAMPDIGVRWVEDVKSIAELQDKYAGVALKTTVNSFRFGIKNANSSATNTTMFEDLTGVTIRAGETIRIGLVYAYVPNGSDLRSQSYQNVVLRVVSGDSRTVTSYGDIYLRNVGSAINPELECVTELYVEISAFTDTVVTGIGCTFSGVSTFKWVGRQLNVSYVSNNAAVVSKLQELIAFYAANPPEADDVRAQSDMQREIQQADLADAQASLTSVASSADPSTLLTGIPGATLASSVTSAFDSLGWFFVVFPWMGIVMTVFIFSMVLRVVLVRR